MPLNRISQAVPSSIIVSQANTTRSIANNTASMTACKVIVITYPGTYRIAFNIRGSTTLTAQIFKNGGAYGQIHRATSTASVTFVDILGGWSKGDLCGLYFNGDGASAGSGVVDVYQIAGSYNNSDIPIPAGKVTTDTDV